MDILFFTALSAFIVSCLAIPLVPALVPAALVVMAVAIGFMAYSIWSNE